MRTAAARNLVTLERTFTMIKIQLDSNGKEKLQEAAKKSAQQGKTAVRWLGRKIK
jgi:hypothetical protein